ncbi:MAG: hypothetical protein ABGZ53_14750 [Fuerstiella sp.]
MRPQSRSQDHPPSWLQRLINDVTCAIVDHDSHAPIGCHVYRNSATTEWEISAFVSSTEVVGGPMDGTEVNPPVQLDISSVMELFDARPTVHWQSDSVAVDDELAQHISFQGSINGIRVWLRMLRGAPDGTSPGRLVHAGSGEIENLW